MKKTVCNYAPVRFLPYRETGEFVNVGVVVHCPQTDYFAYCLVPQRQTHRVTEFFPELEVSIFKAAIQGITRELDRIQTEHHQVPANHEVAPKIATEQITRFRELIRRREGLLHFGDGGTLLAETPEGALADLFGRFVERQFAHKKEYQEDVMRKRLAIFLREWNLTNLYETNITIGDDDFHVMMPFVHLAERVPTRAIKPLDLDKAETSDVYHHGGVWVKNMERLRKRETMPEKVIFSVRLPAEGKRLDAANEICNELEKIGVEAVEFDDTRRLRTFVTV